MGKKNNNRETPEDKLKKLYTKCLNEGYGSARWPGNLNIGYVCS